MIAWKLIPILHNTPIFSACVMQNIPLSHILNPLWPLILTLWSIVIDFLINVSLEVFREYCHHLCPHWCRAVYGLLVKMCMLMFIAVTQMWQIGDEVTMRVAVSCVHLHTHISAQARLCVSTRARTLDTQRQTKTAHTLNPWMHYW